MMPVAKRNARIGAVVPDPFPTSSIRYGDTDSTGARFTILASDGERAPTDSRADAERVGRAAILGAGRCFDFGIHTDPGTRATEVSTWGIGYRIAALEPAPGASIWIWNS
jgi:hypothetical protein